MAAPRPLAAALAAAGAWLLEPAEPARAQTLTAPAALRPVIAVFGLAHGCGATVVARALAAELARRDALGAAAVQCESRVAGIPLATPAAARLARALADLPGAETRAVGRLCLIGGADGALVADNARHVAPLVLDAGTTAVGGVPAALADEVIVVATPATEPALAAVAADCLGRMDREPIVVLNRARPAGTAVAASAPGAADAAAPVDYAEPSGWAVHAAHELPDSRMGAQLALGGREPRGALGRAVAELADRCCEGRR
jgi:hypothetical protein